MTKGTTPCFLKGLENIERVPLICVVHFGELPEDGGSTPGLEILTTILC